MNAWEKAQQIFTERFGDNWSVNIQLILRASDISWLVHLIQEGIKSRKSTMGQTAGEMASIADFYLTLENLVEQLKTAQEIKKEPKFRFNIGDIATCTKTALYKKGTKIIIQNRYEQNGFQYYQDSCQNTFRDKDLQ